MFCRVVPPAIVADPGKTFATREIINSHAKID